MTARQDHEPTRLWDIRAQGFAVLFAGTLVEMVAELARLDRARDARHAAIEVRP